MANIDPVEAMLNALTSYLATTLAGAPVITVRKGFPEADTELALEVGPVLAVTHLGTEAVLCTPRQVDIADTQSHPTIHGCPPHQQSLPGGISETVGGFTRRNHYDCSRPAPHTRSAG